MNGTLKDVFEITNRGIVVAVEILDGVVLAGDSLVVGGNDWPITGVEMINYNEEGRKRLAEGWIPPVGLLLGGASKNDLISFIGNPVGTIEQRRS